MTEARPASGFDPQRLRFGLRTALAASVALVLAWLMGLEHPQWSAMTVWIAAQPVRNQLLEKSLFRLAGTVVGTGAGVALLLATGGQPLPLVVGLALWVGLCAAAGNVQRGFLGYGSLLAGYSAAMVALLDLGRPEHIQALAVDRLLTVAVGVAVALLANWLVVPRANADPLRQRLLALTSRLLNDIAAQLRGHAPASAETWVHGFFTELAAIDAQLDPLGAGSLRGHASVRACRSLLAALVNAGFWVRERDAGLRDEALAQLLSNAASALDDGASPATVHALLRPAIRHTHPELRTVLAGLRTSLDRVLQRPPDARRPGPPLVLHRDWIGARQAGLRAAGAMLAAGAAWVLTGWPQGPLLLLGTSVMVSLFSTLENPAAIMGAVIRGQALGAAAALACQWLLWPLAASDAERVLLMLPLVLAGALLYAHRRSAPSSFDYNMIMLILLQPALPHAPAPLAALAAAGAVLLSPVLALAAYRWVFPTTARSRMGTLVRMMVHEVQALATTRKAWPRRRVWRARLSHRLLALVRWVERTGSREMQAADGIHAVLRVGEAVLGLQRLRTRTDLAPSARRPIELALARAARLSDEPATAARTLRRVGERLAGPAPADALRLRKAAGALDAQSAFFALAQAAT